MSFWQPVQADSQPKSSGLVLGPRPLGAILHSSNELGELSQWLCHDDSTINIVVIIIIIIIISKSSISQRSPSVLARDMHLVDLHVPTSHRSLELNPDLQSLAATQAERTAASDLRHRVRLTSCLCHCICGLQPRSKLLVP